MSSVGLYHTVVKWGHTEGIPREKTSSQKYTVIALHFWRNEFFLVFQIWGQNTIGGQFLEHCHLIWNCPWFLKRFLIFQIWGYYLQKVNAKCPQISDEKDKFFSIDDFFSLFFFKGSKAISQREKTFFFIKKLRASCIYFLQVLPAKPISWCHLILMKKCPWIMINFALWKWWHLW